MLGLPLAPVAAPSASAACVGPYLLVGDVQHRPSIRAGASLTVEGRAFVRGCDDTGSVNMFGCRSSQGEVETPMSNVVLSLRQGDERWRLGTENAGSAADNRLGHVTWQVAVPAEVETGRALLVADVPPHGRDTMDTGLPVVVRQR